MLADLEDGDDSRMFEFGGGLAEPGAPEPSAIPNFSAEYIQPLYSTGRTLLTWVALSGEPADIARADRLALELFSSDEAATRWIRLQQRSGLRTGLNPHDAQ